MESDCERAIFFDDNDQYDRKDRKLNAVNAGLLEHLKINYIFKKNQNVYE